MTTTLRFGQESALGLKQCATSVRTYNGGGMTNHRTILRESVRLFLTVAGAMLAVMAIGLGVALLTLIV